MAAALPPLRTDLIIEAVAPTAGDPAYDVSSPDLSRTHRVTSQAYMALSMIDGRKDFLGWSAAVQQMYPELDLGQLHHLASVVDHLGYFSERAALPAAPGPMNGRPLIYDLADPAPPAARMPAIPTYDSRAPTLPGHVIPGLDLSGPSLSNPGLATALSGPPEAILSDSPATDELDPMAAMDALFSTGGPPPLPHPSAPNPVTAVSEPNPLLASALAAGVAPPAADADSISLDLDIEFGEDLAPQNGPSAEKWTAPDTAVPNLPFAGAFAGGGPAAATPDLRPPSLPLTQPQNTPTTPGSAVPGGAIVRDVAVGGAMLPQATDEFPPMIASLPSGEGRGDRPLTWPDLLVEKTDSKDLVAVTGPQKGIPFQIYELEHRMLMLMDGERGLPELLEAVRQMGHGIDQSQLMSFVRQMDAYGFLETTGPLTRKIDKERMWAPKPPDNSLHQEPWPAEERRLFQVGLGHFRDGKTEKAISFFEALLEVNPDNPEARSMLDLMQGSRPAPSALEMADTGAGSNPGVAGAGVLGVTNLAQTGTGFPVSAPTLEEDGGSKKAKRSGWVFRAAFFLAVLSTAGALAGLYVEQPVRYVGSATVLAAENVKVSAPKAGKVTAVLATVGQALKAGEPILTFSPTTSVGASADTADSNDIAGLKETIASLQAQITAASVAKNSDSPKNRKALAKKNKRIAKKMKRTLKSLAKKEATLQKKAARLNPYLTRYLKNSNLKTAGAKGERAKKKMAVLQKKIQAVAAKKAVAEKSLAAATSPAVSAAPADLERELKASREQLAALEQGGEVESVAAPVAGVVLPVPPLPAVGDALTAGMKLAAIGSNKPNLKIFLPPAALAGVSKRSPFDFVIEGTSKATFRCTVTAIGASVMLAGRQQVVVEATFDGDASALKPDQTGQAIFTGPSQPVTYTAIDAVLAWAREQGLPVP